MSEILKAFLPGFSCLPRICTFVSLSTKGIHSFQFWKNQLIFFFATIEPSFIHAFHISTDESFWEKAFTTPLKPEAAARQPGEYNVWRRVRSLQTPLILKTKGTINWFPLLFFAICISKHTSNNTVAAIIIRYLIMQQTLEKRFSFFRVTLIKYD